MLRPRGLLRRARIRLPAQPEDAGFTLIELLVVVVIIGILAAAAIPVYLGLSKGSKNSSVETDLADAKIAIINVQTASGALPPSAADVSTVVTAKDGYTRGSNTSQIKYSKGTGTPYAFCLSATAQNGDGSTYFVTDTVGVTRVSATAPTAALPAGC